MSVSGLQQTRSRLRVLKRFGGLVFVALAIAVLVVGVLILTGTLGKIRTPAIRILGFRLPQRITIFLGAFTMSLSIILMYVFYWRAVKRLVRKAVRFWKRLPDWVQALVVGLLAGLVAGLSLWVTDRYLYEFWWVTMVLVGLGVALLVMFITMKVRDRGWELLAWFRILCTSALIGSVIAVLTTFAFTGVVPGYTAPVVFLISWGLCLYLLFRRSHTFEDSIITRILARTGYAQMRQVETLSVSAVTGLAIAVLVALIVGKMGTTPDDPLRRAGFSILLVWPVITIAVSIGWPSRKYENLVIENISVRESTENRVITVRNFGDDPVKLRRTKVTDSNNKLYKINGEVTLGTGEAANFEIPETFELASHEQYKLFGFPFDLVLMRLATKPEYITRDGRRFVLRWIDQLDETEQLPELETLPEPEQEEVVA